MLQALAVKYRPKNFNELVGQNTVSTSLKYALENNRLAHAYLFSGLRGSGKTSSARIFSRALVCENGPSANPCGECSQCLSSLNGSNIDIIEMDAASHR
ncbi:TPA: DNA polymerase III subunit gamma/tau, partial [Campylobacter lari]|nr:DNA polymerase III subunit gamma/tau [Campylobacter lari]